LVKIAVTRHCSTQPNIEVCVCPSSPLALSAERLAKAPNFAQCFIAISVISRISERCSLQLYETRWASPVMISVRGAELQADARSMSAVPQTAFKWICIDVPPKL
jgi:hypothetical protein